MSAETATAISDVILCGGTLYMGLNVGSRPTARTWSATFIALSLAAGLGALYHGVSTFHTPQFWVLVACSSVASAFLFFASCMSLAKPSWKPLNMLWPLMIVAGVLVGGVLASYPFWSISLVAGAATILSCFLIRNASNKKSRDTIYLGVGLTILGLVAQKVLPANVDFNNNVMFHLLQFLGNFMFWRAARMA
jgi:hypothetical protein